MSTVGAAALKVLASGLTVPMETVRQGTARAWASVNQSGVQAVLDSFNIASITDPGTGATKFTYTNAFAHADYSLNHGGITFAAFLTATYGVKTATDHVMVCAISSGAATDSGYATMQVWGDVA